MNNFKEQAEKLLPTINPYACGMGNVVDYNKGICFARLIVEGLLADREKKVTALKKELGLVNGALDIVLKEKEGLLERVETQMKILSIYRTKYPKRVKELEKENEELKKQLQKPIEWIKLKSGKWLHVIEDKDKVYVDGKLQKPVSVEDKHKDHYIEKWCYTCNESVE